MVRHVIMSKPVAGTAVAAIVVSGAALLWHLLACVESPMAFSPSGRDLVFVTMEPYGEGEDPLLAGPHEYRLMVLSDGQHLRTLEATTTCLLAAPTYSPDGRSVCYLRVPLLSAAGLEQLKEAVAKREELGKQLAPLTWNTGTASKPTTNSSSRPAAECADQSLPPVQVQHEFAKRLLTYPSLPAELVVRDAEKGALVSTAPLDLPLLGEDGGLAMAYITMRTQYSPDGQRVYLLSRDVLIAVDPTTGERAVLAAPAAAAALSPDGKLLAFAQDGTLGLQPTAGDTTLYKRWPRLLSPLGMGWRDAQTLVVAEPVADKSEVILHFLDTQGAEQKPLALKLPDHGKHEGTNAGALAVAPGGRHLVLAFDHDTFFLTGTGELAKHWTSATEQLAQPAFAPDGRYVAFKVMQKPDNGYTRAAAIAFFSPEGEELTRVAVPAIDRAATQPASGPATQPTSQPTTKPAGM